MTEKLRDEDRRVVVSSPRALMKAVKSQMEQFKSRSGCTNEGRYRLLLLLAELHTELR